jgi:hypothetical protein
VDSTNVSDTWSFEAEGYELSVVFNPSPRWRVALTGSTNKNVLGTHLASLGRYLATNSDFQGLATWRRFASELRRVESGQRSAAFDLDPADAAARSQAGADALYLEQQIASAERTYLGRSRHRGHRHASERPIRPQRPRHPHLRARRPPQGLVRRRHPTSSSSSPTTGAGATSRATAHHVARHAKSGSARARGHRLRPVQRPQPGLLAQPHRRDDRPVSGALGRAPALRPPDAESRARHARLARPARAHAAARFLQQAGYRTGHFGKWHLTNRQTPGAPRPEAYGIDEWAVFNGGAGWPAARTHDTADNAIAFIRTHRDRPFFLNVWLHETHTPHVALPRGARAVETPRRAAAGLRRGRHRWRPAVGRILDALREAGLEQNTLVIFSADNGPERTGKVRRPAYTEGDSGVTGYDTFYSVGETGGLRGRKRSLFEGGVRVPFLVRWPGRAPAGTRNDLTVLTAVDLLPTLCAAARAPLPPDYRGDGENLLSALLGRPVTRTRPIFWEWRGNQTEPDWWPRLAVRDGDWKLLLTYDAARVSLHRVTADRAEARNVALRRPRNRPASPKLPA